MTLINLLEVIDENIKKVEVLDLNNNLISFYDGKNSIDEKYNNKAVKAIATTKTGVLQITINLLKI